MKRTKKSFLGVERKRPFKSTGEINTVFPKGPLKPFSSIEHDEFQFLFLILSILEKGSTTVRHGLEVLSEFAPKEIRFKLDGQFPLLTTSKVDFKQIVTETLWILKGSVTTQGLEKASWKMFDDRMTLNSLGLQHHKEGEVGPFLGFQLRHYGAEYTGPDVNYTDQGIDQISDIIEILRTNPQRSQILLTSWHPASLRKVEKLRFCPIDVQFYTEVRETTRYLNAKVSLQVINVCSLPQTIASYSLLVYIIAHCCNLKPCSVVFSVGDAFLYQDHVDKLKDQLTRSPFPLPTVEIRNETREINDLRVEDFELDGYYFNPKIEY